MTRNKFSLKNMSELFENLFELFDILLKRFVSKELTIVDCCFIVTSPVEAL